MSRLMERLCRTGKEALTGHPISSQGVDPKQAPRVLRRKTALQGGERIVKAGAIFLWGMAVAAAIVALVCPGAAMATAPWVNLGLYGGQVYSIAIDPVSPNKMFAGAYYGGGLFVTTDAGSHWNAVLTGQEDGELEGEATFRNTAVRDVEIAPSNHHVIWASHDYWVEYSTDGGVTWTHIYNGAMQDDCAGCPNDSPPGGLGTEQFRFCNALAVHPTDPETVYVGTGGPHGNYSDGAIYKTSDGGASWTKMAALNYTVVDLEIDKANPNVVWALTYSHGDNGIWYSSLYRSGNGGETWEETLWGYMSFFDIALKPDDPNKVFIATYCGLVLYDHTVPSVAFVFPSGTYDCTRNVRAVAFSPSNPNVLYIAWGETKVSRSADGGRTWTTFFPGRQFITLAVRPSNSNKVFGGELQTGVYGGSISGPWSTWKEINNGISAIQVYDIDIHPKDSKHLLAGTGAGVYEKRGDGPWIKTSNLPYTAAYSVAFDRDDADGSSYYAGGEGWFYRTTDHGVSWSQSATWLGYVFVTDIAAAGGGSIFVSTRSWESGSGGIWKSTDGGSVFELKHYSNTFDFNAVTVDPNNPDIVFAGGGNYFAPLVNGGLFKSTDGGETFPDWSLATEVVNAILVDPDRSNVVYAGCGYSAGTGAPLYKSTDGGLTWAKAYLGIPGEKIRSGIWGSGASDILVLGHNGSVAKGGADDRKVLHYDGIGWSEMHTGIAGSLRALWGVSASLVVAVGDQGTVAGYNGSGWGPMNSGTTEDLSGVWGWGTGDFLAVGRAGTILRYDGNPGGTWSKMVSGTLKDLTAVWGYVDGSGPHAFAVGALGTVLQYSPLTDSWSLMGTGSVTERLEGVWGTSNGSVIFAVGNPWMDGAEKRYTILINNGASWTRMPTPPVPAGKSGKLRGIWGVSENDLLAVGDDGAILHYDGLGWSDMNSGTGADLYDVWGTAAGGGPHTVYAVGAYGTLIKYTSASGAWSAESGILEGRATWNPVTDLSSKIENGTRALYASTARQGVYASPNGGRSWTSLGVPPYIVHALSVGSVVVATQGGSYGAGWGWMWGQAFDEKTLLPIDSALIQTSGGHWHTTDAAGFYHMSIPAGEYHVTCSAAGYAPEMTPAPTPVLSGGATQVTFYLLDPVITIRIDAQEVKAQEGVFRGAGGTISPVDGDGYQIDAQGDLLVQHLTGWAKLGFQANPGNAVSDVRVNGQSVGPIPSHTFSQVTGPQTLEVLFATQTAHPGDWDKDCDVDGLDLAALVMGGQIDLNALAAFAGHFGSVGCP